LTARVVDASIVAKWFIPEIHFREARLLRTSGDSLLAPDLMAVELARLLLKKVRRGEMTEAQARRPLAANLDKTVRFYPMLSVLNEAVEISFRFQRDPFDAVYVALALQEQCTFVTADRVLYDALAGAYSGSMVWVGDLPRLLDAGA
jgi:predicted nucleic acid-binding protein